MSRFVDKSEVEVIRAGWWDEDEEVTIKKFTYGDRQAFTRAMMRGLRVQQKGKKGAEIPENEAGRLMETDIGSMNLLILERGIKTWTFKDEKGNVVPPTRRHIEMLEPKTADFILEAINEFNPDEEEDEEGAEGFRDCDRDSNQE
jgi:hypothetical protein